MRRRIWLVSVLPKRVSQQTFNFLFWRGAHQRVLVLSGVALILYLLIASRPSMQSIQEVEQLSPKTTKESDNLVQPRVVKDYGNLPLSFEINQGQTDPAVNFISRGNGYALYLTPGEAVLAISKPADPSTRDSDDNKVERSAALRIQIVGANPNPQVMGLQELSGKVNYLVGNSKKEWRTEIPTYAKVQYKNVYPGIDLIYYGNQRQLEYDFVVAPGADLSAITLGFEGVDAPDVDDQGNLVLQVAGGQVQFHKPVAYQDVDGVRQEVQCSYKLHDNHYLAFEIAAYDSSKSLVIDPVVSYSTYLGGSGEDHGVRVAVDADGNAYIVGYTSSIDFPTESAVQSNNGGGFYDAFVVKLNSTGTALSYATYLGGSGEDYGINIIVDTSGNAYITGWTDSFNFPMENPVQSTSSGLHDAFIVKLNSAGSALLFSTYLGGSGHEASYAIALDSSNNILVGGSTTSTNFPTTAGSLQTNYNGGQVSGDAFVTKIDSINPAISYSTYLGGSGDETPVAITVDALGNAYVVGETSSIDFPTSSAFQSTRGGSSGTDAFVSKLNSNGTAPIYSTYLGGSGWDTGTGITVDSSSSVYVTGMTGSSDFPVTANAMQSTNHGGGYDSFATKLNSNGFTLAYSTYLGGSASEQGYGVVVDTLGSAYFAGYTESSDFPTTLNAIKHTLGGGADAYVTRLSQNGTALVYSTYLGGSGSDECTAIALDASANAYVVGFTNSSDFPTTATFQGTFAGGGGDGFIMKLSFSDTTTSTSATPLGNDVLVSPFSEFNMTYSTVSQAGETTVSKTTDAPSLPTGYNVGSQPAYYDISTTASTSGPVTVCVGYDPDNYVDPGSARLLHAEGGVWVDVTTSNDTVNYIVCGQVTSLSPFVVAMVKYNTCLLYDQSKVWKSGSTVPLKLQLCDANGLNLSSPSIILAATGFSKVSNNVSTTAEDSGNANPESNFRYDSTLQGYIYNLSTKGLATGTWALSFSVTGDPVPYTVTLQVR